MTPGAYIEGIEGDEDLALVEAARGGDKRALDALLRRHHDRLFALCRRLTGNDADAADATQEALIAIVRGLNRFAGDARFSTWAYRVATNACLDELRRRKRRAEPGLPDHDHDERLLDPSATGSLASLGGLTLERDAADRMDVSDALRRLPLDFRAAVVLRDLCGLDYAEIAEILAIPPGTVRSRIARGRLALAPLLGNPADDSDRRTSQP